MKCPYVVHIEQESSNLEKLDFSEIIYFHFGGNKSKGKTPILQSKSSVDITSIYQINLGNTAEILLDLFCQFRKDQRRLLNLFILSIQGRPAETIEFIILSIQEWTAMYFEI